MIRHSHAVLAGIAAVTLLAASGQARAVSMQVTPILVELTSSAGASMLSLRSDGQRPVNVQVRAFRWSQSNGQDILEPTEEVVVSPPITTLKPRGDYAVRIVRAKRGPVAREEAYRLLVDEIPDASRERTGMVAMVLRHSVPVFLMPETAAPPELRWSARIQGGRLDLTLTNSGGRRVKISRLKVTAGNQSISFGDGLIGYALAGSSVTWSRPLPPGFAGSATISAQGESGPLNATVRVSGS